MKSTTAKILAAMMAASLALGADASSITIDSVRQRWPWNNKVDIKYTVSGGQDVSSGVFAKIVFNATIGGKTYVIDGVHDIGANASNGTHTVTWTPPADLVVKATDCTMTATLSSADAPSGDDYMVVDLSDGTISYEGLLATQSASNARYNTDEYKQNKLVLRKIPMGAYQVGHANITAENSSNTPKTWDLSRYNDGSTYYIGIFPVTRTQYTRLGLSDPSQYTNHDTGKVLAADDTLENRPVDTVEWTDLRGSDGSEYPLGTLAPSSSGTFLQRLNALTGSEADGYGFDLPTEIMWEIAARAGTTAVYWWGDTPDFTVANPRKNSTAIAADDGMYYSVSIGNAGDCHVAVGTTKPNPWGIWDLTGSSAQLCIDTWGLADLKDAESPYIAYQDKTSALRRNRGGAPWYPDRYDHSRRDGWTPGDKYNKAYGNVNKKPFGFRVVKLAR